MRYAICGKKGNESEGTQEIILKCAAHMQSESEWVEFHTQIELQKKTSEI